MNVILEALTEKGGDVVTGRSTVEMYKHIYNDVMEKISNEEPLLPVERLVFDLLGLVQAKSNEIDQKTHEIEELSMISTGGGSFGEESYLTNKEENYSEYCAEIDFKREPMKRRTYV